VRENGSTTDISSNRAGKQNTLCPKIYPLYMCVVALAHMSGYTHALTRRDKIRVERAGKVVAVAALM
jgi:hypothetical protein